MKDLDTNSTPPTRWDDCTGIDCESCHEEVFQLLDGVCRRCLKKKYAVTEDKIEKRAVFRGLKDRLKEARRQNSRRG